MRAVQRVLWDGTWVESCDLLCRLGRATWQITHSGHLSTYLFMFSPTRARLCCDFWLANIYFITDWGVRIIITSNHLRTCSSNSLWILALYLLRFLSATSCMKLSQSLGLFQEKGGWTNCRNFFSESTSNFVCCVFLLCKQSTLTKTRRGLGKDLCCTKVVHLSTYNIHKYLFIDMMFMDVFIFFCFSA